MRHSYAFLAAGLLLAASVAAETQRDFQRLFKGQAGIERVEVRRGKEAVWEGRQRAIVVVLTVNGLYEGFDKESLARFHTGIARSLDHGLRERDGVVVCQLPGGRVLAVIELAELRRRSL